jgi:hypothetical protein
MTDSRTCVCVCATNKSLTFNIHTEMIDLYLKWSNLIQFFNVKQLWFFLTLWNDDRTDKWKGSERNKEESRGEDTGIKG